MTTVFAVRVEDLAWGGPGSGPFKLFIGEWGVAEWPCRHDPREYAEATASAVRRALAERADPKWTRPRITHVAIRLDGVVWSLPAPYRHHHILNELIPKYSAVKYHDSEEHDQGFLDASGRYLNRRQAEPSAFLHDQVKNGKLIGSILTSEDLW